MKHLFLGLAICLEASENQNKSNGQRAVNVVLFKFKSDASLKQDQNFRSDFLKKYGIVSSLIDVSFGENFADMAKGFTNVKLARLKYQKSLKIFSKSDNTEELAFSYIKPVLEEILVFDYY
ncbi:Dabb family protein [Flavobacterium ustbae]|uniref:Dabb family protein n=1 Tax=Flavobacterium ustbae TaxID=2488790 RepID=UPI000F779357|nr:Dabb family protein [Flavobacterium ustbae]